MGIQRNLKRGIEVILSKSIPLNRANKICTFFDFEAQYQESMQL